MLASTPWERAWLTDQNLAAALAERGRRVLYVEPPLTPLAPLRRPAEARALLCRAPRGTPEGVLVTRPLALPPQRSASARRLSGPWLRAQLGAAVRATGLRAPVVLDAAGVPGLAGAAGESLRAALVKDFLPAGGDLLGRDARGLEGELDAQLRDARLVLGTSRALVEALGARHPHVELLEHGFHAELAPLYDAAATPPDDLAALAGPRLGYAGSIDDRLDFEALGAVADAFPGGSLVLIGAVSPRLPAGRLDALRARPNVALLGPRDRRLLPAYLRHLDCCLLPAKETAWGRHAAPLKLWDYLYAGPPIAGGGYGSLAEFAAPLVHHGTGRELVGAVRRALAEPAGAAEQRRRLALTNSWAARAERLEHLVAEDRK